MDFETLVGRFDFAFSKANFEQWLTAHDEELSWYFHRHENSLLCVLSFDEDDEISVCSISPDGKVSVKGEDAKKSQYALAFLHLLINGELPYTWNSRINIPAVYDAISVFLGKRTIRPLGVVIELHNTYMGRGLRRQFEQIADEVSDELYYENFNDLSDPSNTRIKYPTVFLNEHDTQNYYAFFESEALSRRFSKWHKHSVDQCFFRFSNGALISLREIYFHPYAIILGPNFFENVLFDRSDFALEPHEILGLYDSKEENFFVKNIWKRTLEHGMSLYLAEQKVTNDGLSHLFLRVDSIDQGENHSAEWKLGSFQKSPCIKFRPKIDVSSMLKLSSKIFYDPNRKELHRNMLDKEREFWLARNFEQKKMVDEELVTYLFVPPSSLSVQDFLFLTRIFSHTFKNKIDYDVESLALSEVALRVNYSKEFPKRLEFFMDLTNGDSVDFMPVSLELIFCAMNKGSAALFDDRIDEFIHAKRDQRRKNTLKLLRHAGIFHLLFQQWVDFQLQGKDIKAFEQKGLELTLAIIAREQPSTDKQARELFKQAFGTKAFKLFSSIWRRMDEISRWEHMFMDEEAFYQLDWKERFLPLCVYLSELLQTAIGPGNFAKQRSKDFAFSEGQHWIEVANLYQALFVQDYGTSITLTLEGAPIHDLEEQELKTIFRLDEENVAIDWFELHPEVFLKGKKVQALDDLIVHAPGIIEHRGEVYMVSKKVLPKMQWLDYFWKRLAARKSSKKFAIEGKIEHLPKSQMLEMLAMHAAGMEVKGGERWQNALRAFEKIQKRESENEQIKFHPNFEIPLKDFQKIGTRWLLDLYDLGLGGILADDMGLGKTIQTLGMLEQLRLEERLGHCLVVVPTSLSYNWMSEAARFSPQLETFNFTSETKEEHANFLKANEHTLTVITYGLFSRNCRELEDLLSWNICIFDEAQNLKNITAARTGRARKFGAKTKFCLTGTPMENHYGEFFSLIDLVVPGALGSYSEFMQIYQFKASRGVDVEKLRYHLKFLKLKVAPLLLRRTKEKILDELPEKTETQIRLDFDSRQEKIYRDIALAYNKKIKDVFAQKGEAKSQLEVLSAILRLRQACSYPQALPEVKYDREPPKFLELLSQLEQICEEGHKALVFTNFKSTLNALVERLCEKGIATFSISGETPKRSREKRLKQFEEASGAAVMAMTLKTGGVGLNLTCAQYVFHIEPWWNPASENQATDRAHRMGQKNKVQVYRYIMRESIEEKIQTLKARKSLAIDELLQEREDLDVRPSMVKTGLGLEDFKYLLEIS